MEKRIKNSFAYHIADFLKEYQPFSNILNDELLEIANTIQIINLEKNKTLFEINDVLHDYFYLVASGAISLIVISDAEETFI